MNIKSKIVCGFTEKFAGNWKIAILMKNVTACSSEAILGRGYSSMPEVEKEKELVRKTALYDLHVHEGAKIVKFAGYYLPLKYGNVSIAESHSHTRNSCSLFDVSHMLQTRITGKDCVEFLESLCVADLKGMKCGTSTLTLLTSSPSGGIVDDVIVTKISEDHLFIVSNASRQDVDKSLLYDALDRYTPDARVYIEFLETEQQSLLAIQGPKTAKSLQPLINVDLSKLYFMNSVEASVCSVDKCRITRCGYTGEDGVEISVPSNDVTKIVERLLRIPDIKLAGLGARDSLRLEAGLCLYGTDIDENITPVEAGLAWTMGKRRRELKNFPGANAILHQLLNKTGKRRVGLSQNGGPVPRTGSELLNSDGEKIGFVTSGCPSPSLGKNIAMGYVPISYAKSDTKLKVSIRGHIYDVCITKLPFITTRYYIKPKNT